MASVLIVDDLLSIHEMLDAVIQPTGFTTAFATDGEKALARYKAEKPDLVLCDIDMKPMDGITLLRHLRQLDPQVVVIIMTAYASVDSALQALKLGAFDYLQKPFRVNELIDTLRRGMDYKQDLATEAAQAVLARAATEAPMPRSEDAKPERKLVGSSSRFSKVTQQVKRLSSVKTPALLQGEPGTGKSLIAEVLHQNGPHADKHLVRVDCSHHDINALRTGLIGTTPEGGTWLQEAKGGTLCIHHVQQFPLPLQKEFVGVLRSHANDFRLITTTTEDLEALTDQGKFLDELLYRIAALPVQVPPLRERSEDIPELIDYFASHTSNPFFDATLIEFTDDAMDVMRTYHWPGNVTELHQVISKIATSTEARVITTDHLPMRIRELKSWPSMADFLATQQRHYADSVLRAARGDKAKAAKILGVPAEQLR